MADIYVRARAGRNFVLIEVKLDGHDRFCQWAASWLVQRGIETPQVARPSYSETRATDLMRVSAPFPATFVEDAASYG